MTAINFLGWLILVGAAIWWGLWLRLLVLMKKRGG